MYTTWILLLFLFLLLTISASSSPPPPTNLSYSDHCSSLVPEAIPAGLPIDDTATLHLTGSDNLRRQVLDPRPVHSSFFSLYVPLVYRTKTPGVHKLDGTLDLHARRRRIELNLAEPGPSLTWVRFNMSGFWSEITGKLCMVGSGSSEGNPLDFSAVLKLHYPKNSNIYTSLVSGTIQSLDSPDQFDSVSFLAYSQMNYEYTLIPQAEESCSSSSYPLEPSISFEMSGLYNFLEHFPVSRYELEYGSDCPHSNCSFFGGSLMFLRGIRWSGDGRVRLYLVFTNPSEFDYLTSLSPDNTLIAEGVWDHGGNRLCLAACRLLNPNRRSTEKASVGDCTIRLSLWFPAALSVRNRRSVVGRIWSTDSDRFTLVKFRSTSSYALIVPGVRYEYTVIEAARKSCMMNDDQNSRKRRYPDEESLVGMRFGVSVRNAEGRIGWGEFVPLTVGDRSLPLRGRSSMVDSTRWVEKNQSLWKVSYNIRYRFPDSSSGLYEPAEIAAEGIYSTESGVLCMVGCRSLNTSTSLGKGSGDSMDCSILIRIKIPALDSEDEDDSNGWIRSMRGVGASYLEELLLFIPRPSGCYASMPLLNQST